jgi:hypothetical protein
MAGIAANGDKLPPLIIFKGKNFLGDWNGSNPYPGTQIAKSENGWMVTNVFCRWFESSVPASHSGPFFLCLMVTLHT